MEKCVQNRNTKPTHQVAPLVLQLHAGPPSANGVSAIAARRLFIHALERLEVEVGANALPAAYAVSLHAPSQEFLQSNEKREPCAYRARRKEHLFVRVPAPALTSEEGT